jgi:malate synthase
MEDAATAEISRTQLWQWLHAGKLRFDGTATPIDFALFDATLATVRQRLAATPMPGQSRVARAAELLGALTHAETLADFLTLAAYPDLP